MALRIGFFRGLNVGGKNKLSMAELKESFQEMGYQTLETIGNTGIILFDGAKSYHSDTDIAEKVSNKAAFPTSFLSIAYEELAFLQQHAPSWWNQNKDWRHNAIFLLGDYSAETLLAEIPPVEEPIEKIMRLNNTLLWSSAFADRKLYYQSQYRKLLKHEAYPLMTIRNANTLNKTYLAATKMLAASQKAEKS